MLDFLLRLEPERPEPMYAQLFGQLRSAILAGRLPGGAKLPSTRGLADLLGVSRNTVTEAYAQLLADGYLTARHGSGTYVSGELPPAPLRADRRPGSGPARETADSPNPAPAALQAGLSRWARRLEPTSPTP